MKQDRGRLTCGLDDGTLKNYTEVPSAININGKKQRFDSQPIQDIWSSSIGKTTDSSKSSSSSSSTKMKKIRPEGKKKSHAVAEIPNEKQQVEKVC
uniref:ELM2 domain-containing protein n=1 Tax=Loa loa TaxID=7209 RepID=A0A1I7VV77_LOALO